jgi:hypothetical protein
VVVIDAISMFHPWLSQCINNASIGVHKHIAILVVSPVDATILPLNQYIEQAFIENMERAYKRFDTKYDHLCEIDLGNLRSLRRWFFRAIPETARLKMHRDVPLYANVDSMRQIQANKPQFGIDPIALSMGGI